MSIVSAAVRACLVSLTFSVATGCSDSSTTGSDGAGGAAGTTGTGGSAGTTGTGGSAGSAGTSGAAGAVSTDLFSEPRTLNIAHRGGRSLAPEATLPAYENAMRVGADVLEMDVHATSDGVLVVIHDDTVDRTTDGTGAVKDMTFAELRALDAAYDFSPDGTTFPERGKGIQVPTLEEILDAFPEGWFVIEIKQSEPSITAEFAQLLANKQVEDRVVAGSFDANVNIELRALAPSLRTSFGLTEVVDFLFLEPMAEASYVPPGEFLQVPIEQSGVEVISQDFADKAARFDLGIHAWTINDPADMTWLIGLGVAGIITDDPALLAEQL